VCTPWIRSHKEHFTLSTLGTNLLQLIITIKAIKKKKCITCNELGLYICFTLWVIIKYFIFFLFFIWLSIIHHHYINVKFNLIQYTFHGHEKTTCLPFFFSYSCWWVGNRSEIIITKEMKYLFLELSLELFEEDHIIDFKKITHILVPQKLLSLKFFKIYCQYN
jgi:hypothetical protein